MTIKKVANGSRIGPKNTKGFIPGLFHYVNLEQKYKNKTKQAGAELCQAQH